MAKTPNYTPEQTDVMRRMYIEVASESEARRAEVVKEIARMFNKSPRSIVAKLSRENVYVAKKPVAKDGSPVMSKADLGTLISMHVGLPVDSSINMTKEDMKKIIIAFQNLRDELEDAQDDSETED
jgi:capsular polysaccharide biosynthesis protein